jgi:hypothetical protein
MQILKMIHQIWGIVMVSFVAGCGLPVVAEESAGFDQLTWIWHPDDDGGVQAGQSSYFFVHDVNVTEACQAAWVRVYSGTGYRFFVNGSQSGHAWYSGHGTFRHDLKPHLRPGKNTLAIEVYRGHVHAGLLVVGELKLSGKTETIASIAGPDWRVSKELPSNWPNVSKKQKETFHPSISLPPRLVQHTDRQWQEWGHAMSTFDPKAFGQQIRSKYKGKSLDEISVPGERVVAASHAGLFPIVQRMPNGHLVALIRQGIHIAIDGSLALIFSYDHGRSWTTPKTIASGPTDFRNPAMGILPDGRIVVAFVVYDNFDSLGNWNVTFETSTHRRADIDGQRVTIDKRTGERAPEISRERKELPAGLLQIYTDDGGKSWSLPERITFSGEQGLKVAAPFGKMVNLPDGTLLLSYYGYDSENRPGAAILASRDRGRTWTLRKIIARGYNETALCLLPSGKLLAMLRAETEKVDLWQSISSDDGITWSIPRRITGDQEHPADVIVLPGGELLLTYGHRHFPYGFQCRISKDEGNSWIVPKRFILSADAITNDCGYPSSAVAADGTIVSLYYSIGSRFTPTRGIHALAVRYRLEDLGVR